MSARLIENLLIGQLRPWPRNARTHSRKQIRQITESIRRFGFTNPVLVDGENRILAGHGRVEAARELGMATVPCLRIEHMSAAEKRAYVLADNKLAINAGWDEELLALELKELMEADLGFDIGVTGFTIPEVDQLMEGLAPEEAGDPADDRLPGLDRLSPRCKPGDLWRLGPHRLVCGDALDPGVVAALMDGEKAEMVFTDPPYNVAIKGNVSGLGKTRIVSSRWPQARCRRTSSPVSFQPPSPTWSPILMTDRSTSSAWTGGTWLRSSKRAAPITRNSKTSSSGRRTMAGWGHSIAPGMNSFSRSRTVRLRTSTVSSSDSMGAIARISGNIVASTP